MGWVLLLIGLPGLVVGLISLVRPIEKLRIHDRKLAGVVLAASFFVLTAGVVTSPTPWTADGAPTPTTVALFNVTPTTGAKVEPSDDPFDSKFILAIRGGSARHGGAAWVDVEDDETLIELGQGWCESFDEDRTFESVGLETISTLTEDGDTLGRADVSMIGYAMAAAIDAYCPEHLGRIDAEAGG